MRIWIRIQIRDPAFLVKKCNKFKNRTFWSFYLRTFETGRFEIFMCALEKQTFHYIGIINQVSKMNNQNSKVADLLSNLGIRNVELWIQNAVLTSFADPDPTFHFHADPDSDFIWCGFGSCSNFTLWCKSRCRSCFFEAVLDPACHADANADPSRFPKWNASD